MDPYVFGAAYYYVLMILLTIYLFLFAAPSTAKLVGYPILSYGLVMVDVLMVCFVYRLIVKGSKANRIRSLVYMLNGLTDPITLFIILFLMIREKCLTVV